jgi:hypothetical protein
MSRFIGRAPYFRSVPRSDRWRTAVSLRCRLMPRSANSFRTYNTQGATIFTTSNPHIAAT